MQDGHQIETYVEEFLSLAHQVNWNDGTLKIVFWTGLDDQLYLLAPAVTNPGTLAQYIELLLDGSSFTVGEEDDDDGAGVTQFLMSQTPCKCPPESPQVPVLPEFYSEVATALVPLGVLVENEGMFWDPEPSSHSSPLVPSSSPSALLDTASSTPPVRPQVPVPSKSAPGCSSESAPECSSKSIPECPSESAPECSSEPDQEPTQITESDQEPTQVIEPDQDPTQVKSWAEAMLFGSPVPPHHLAKISF
ncbi:hypothetical protein QQF64_033817 [Cirrhinus molitorella]|uniref:Uncharacterized protein n=1 Tax=Cirrhinus molitorella TaxID=172907 RepID=A0ABR3LHK4_9TELE